MRVDMLASHPHYADHIRPVFEALPDGVKGIIRHHPPQRRGEAADITLVAGPVDMQGMTGNPVVWIEHGIGQSYIDVLGSFSHPGARHPRHVIGYVSPSEPVAAAWGRAAVAVGCPKLDRYLPNPPKPEPRTLAISWRWTAPLAKLCPELRSAREHYAHSMRIAVERWRAEGWTVLGHGHPRARPELTTYWRNLGIRPTWDSFEVLERSALVISDGISFMYEAAALGRAVLVLNAPWYRRDVEHGMRFWSHMPGGDLDNTRQLADLDIAAYVDEDWGRTRRHAAVAHVYAHTDGGSSARAAAFVVSLLDAGPRDLVRGARSNALGAGTSSP